MISKNRRRFVLRLVDKNFVKVTYRVTLQEYHDMGDEQFRKNCVNVMKKQPFTYGRRGEYIVARSITQAEFDGVYDIG